MYSEMADINVPVVAAPVVATPVRRACVRCLKWVADPQNIDVLHRCSWPAGSEHLRCFRCAENHKPCVEVSAPCLRPLCALTCHRSRRPATQRPMR